MKPNPLQQEQDTPGLPQQTSVPKEQEIHIAGVIVYCDRTRIDGIRSHIALLPDAQCHAQSEQGKLVITLETGSTKHTLDCMDAIRALPGVYDVSLVYQHAEPAAAMEQEVEL